ncbi:MAG: hypothetical protein OMM_03650 [Candidatus Magnetoglobus multicellularis str. Araruama]|uniref:TIR domain-containing protein n=1 Tax=Candidatus Magnetoglobus multicellularis str. Araruama TaxID=890399 RepID=A0A1V1P526_9BACT|nr:MAG: hypothetical protein OMM_03650 [Candidatus Magnetoglobus multicellularis str. Araruama]
MGFKYSCFISYSSGQKELIQKFIYQIEESLNAEIELYMKDYPVFLDRERLQIGDKFNESIAISLCQSICMVAVLTPAYYSNPYCLREYTAMENLEKERFEKMQWSQSPEMGLIFPIVFRNSDRMPDIIKESTQWVDFSKYSLSQPELLKDTTFNETIQKIAQRIFDYFENFNELEINLCKECESFKLPSQDKIPELLKKVQTKTKTFSL